MTRREFIQVGSVGALAVGVAGAGRAGPARRRFRFFLWNDMHVRATDVPSRPPGYPFANEKAAWAVECAQGGHGVERPDFVVSAGDIIDGEIPDYHRDFASLKAAVLGKLPVPFLPCVGNHENGQGEGIPNQNLGYDCCFGLQWHNYVFTRGGVGFVVVDTSSAHRTPDEVTGARNRFVRRALDRLADMPILVVSHVPLIAIREEEPLKKSFGFSSWRVLDPEMLRLLEERSGAVAAVLSGHIHLTGARRERGIYHITSAGTAGYPSDFASFDVFDDRIEVQMHKAPDRWLDRAGDIHGKPRHAVDYTDAEHSDHERHVWGNPDERKLTISLEGTRRPRGDGQQGLTVSHESAPGRWEENKKD